MLRPAWKKVRPRSDGGPTEVRWRSDWGPTEVRLRSDWGPTEVRPRSDRGPTEVRRRSDRGPTEVRLRSGWGPTDRDVLLWLWHWFKLDLQSRRVRVLPMDLTDELQDSAEVDAEVDAELLDTWTPVTLRPFSFHLRQPGWPKKPRAAGVLGAWRQCKVSAGDGPGGGESQAEADFAKEVWNHVAARSRNPWSVSCAPWLVPGGGNYAAQNSKQLVCENDEANWHHRPPNGSEFPTGDVLLWRWFGPIEAAHRSLDWYRREIRVLGHAGSSSTPTGGSWTFMNSVAKIRQRWMQARYFVGSVNGRKVGGSLNLHVSEG